MSVDSTILGCRHHWLGLDPFKGRALSMFCAMTFTWMGNRYFTFPRSAGARQSSAPSFMNGCKFVAANIVGALVNFGVYAALVHFASAPLNNKYIALVIGVLAGLIFNFTLSKKLVFKGRRSDL